MTATAMRTYAGPAGRHAARPWLMGPVDPLVMRDAARVLVALVLVLLALAAMAATGAYLAGPVPAVGPAPGLSL